MQHPGEEPKDHVSRLRLFALQAIGGGIPGAAAMVIQVLALMWLRTVINYQYAHGGDFSETFQILYAEGGIGRLYQGLGPALIQGPLSRFGDTATNAGVLGLLEHSSVPLGCRTALGSVLAAFWRMFIMPVDTVKTVLQVGGDVGLGQLWVRIEQHGIGCLYNGACAAALATLIGHFPWFAMHNYLTQLFPEQSDGLLIKLTRRASIGFASSVASDCISNSVRVVKTIKQTSQVQISYSEALFSVVQTDGVLGLLSRGLGTKIVSNAISAMLFTVLWKWFMQLWQQHWRIPDPKSQDTQPLISTKVK